MARLYLVRHAATQPNGEAAANWPLSPLGERQAHALADHTCWQEITRIVSSPEEKAVASVQPAATRYHLPLEVANDLRELQRPPAWVSQEIYQQTVADVFANPDQSVHEWEPARAVRSRMATTIAALVDAYASDTLALVSHGLALSIWLADLLGEPRPSLAAWRAIPFAAVACVDLDQRTMLAPFSTYH